MPSENENKWPLPPTEPVARRERPMRHPARRQPSLAMQPRDLLGPRKATSPGTNVPVRRPAIGESTAREPVRAAKRGGNVRGLDTLTRRGVGVTVASFNVKETK